MPKKIPLRQCVGCREMKPKKELVRVVRSPQGEISIDTKGKAPGRGAYVCPSQQCLQRLGQPYRSTTRDKCFVKLFLFMVLLLQFRMVSMPIPVYTTPVVKSTNG